MTVVLRADRAANARAVREVHIAAFPTTAEADLVERLRKDGDDRVSLLAEVDGEIIGHIMLSQMDVVVAGTRWDALGLGPVAVKPERQREGIGQALVEKSISAARVLGVQMLFVLGDPAYYGRFGFEARLAEPFASPYAGPYLQALMLRDGLELSATGRADYAAAFAQLS